ncbi:MAG TPA: sulfurtransferase [Gemmatimonadales bacterium]|nr:sulfurtransferase [Gemmatimonadales bacterium]
MQRILSSGLPAALCLAAACSSSRAPSDAAAPAVSLPRTVSTDELATWMRAGPVVLVDVRTDVFAYLRGHLLGAAYLNTETLRATRGGIPTRLLDAGTYAALFSRMGLPFDRRVVIYSAGETRNIDATFLAWLLAGFGHPQVFVLEGGFFKWQLEQRPVVGEYPRLAETRFPAEPFRPEQASLEDVQRALRGDGAILVDARPPDQYAGEAGAQLRHGHIPGAINHYWQDDLGLEGFGYVWKPREQLRASYAAQGITPDKDIIAYCNSATEASHVHFTLRYLLGYPRVRVYVGSWTEWAERRDLPIEVGKP